MVDENEGYGGKRMVELDRTNGEKKMEEMGKIDEHGITGDKLAWSLSC